MSGLTLQRRNDISRLLMPVGSAPDRLPDMARREADVGEKAGAMDDVDIV